MAKIVQLRGMLLEEAVLHLLRATGYRTVDEAGDDPCMHNGPSGIEVLGRGGKHQIDAIADFIISQPFSNPQRLLVEAKFYDQKPANLLITRNAVGVLKDVSEFWVSTAETAPKGRYHYQYAVFSATGYTAPAEKYAFAQDIYLIPLKDSTFMKPILSAIAAVDHEDFSAPSNDNISISISRFRRKVRSYLRQETNSDSLADVLGLPSATERMSEFFDACWRLDGALLAMLGGRFPVFLVPSPDLRIANLAVEQQVRIFWDNSGWYIRRPGGNQNLFSFDLPPDLFSLFQRDGLLDRRQALNLKEQYLSDFQAISVVDSLPRVIFFRLQPGWLDSLRDNASEKQRRRQSQDEEQENE